MLGESWYTIAQVNSGYSKEILAASSMFTDGDVEKYMKEEGLAKELCILRRDSEGDSQPKIIKTS